MANVDMQVVRLLKQLLDESPPAQRWHNSKSLAAAAAFAGYMVMEFVQMRAAKCHPASLKFPDLFLWACEGNFSSVCMLAMYSSLQAANVCFAAAVCTCIAPRQVSGVDIK